MYRIETKGYDKKQKTIISNQYLIPKIIKVILKDEIIIPDETIEYLAENVTDKEKVFVILRGRWRLYIRK